jgi:diguanylate cyclase (GGDEF)-like protein/PAS domain S-box-containing protein
MAHSHFLADTPPVAGMHLGAATRLARWLAIALGYYLAARLGLAVPYVGTHVSLVWLPTGLAIAGLLRWGPGMAPAVFAAATAANATLGGPLWLALAIGAGNTLGPWVATLLLSRWGFQPQLARRRDVAVFLLASLLGMLVSASNGTAWLLAAGLLQGGQWPVAWLSWWIGDTVSALLGGVPLAGLGRATLRRAFLGRPGIVNTLLQAAVLACGLAAFSPWIGNGSPLLFPLVSLPFFLVTLLGLRAGMLSSSLAVLMLSVAAAYGTSRGLGPFAGHAPGADTLALWSYLTAQACTSLLVCTLAAELQTSRRRLAAVVRHAHDGIVLIGPDDRLIAVNPAAMAMLGLSSEDVAGRSLDALPRGNGLLLGQWLQQHPGAASTDLQLEQPDGRRLPVECQSARYLDAAGHRQTHLVLRDLSARKRAEAQLVESEQRLRLVTDNIPALICYVGRDYRLLFANRMFETWLGLDRQAILGRDVREVFGQRTFDSRRPFVEQAFESGEVVDFELAIEGPGQPRVLRSTYVPDRAPGGAVRGIYSVSVDITDMAQLARFDHLTGLPNRHHFEQSLESALARARRSGQALALMIIDVDHFKDINDTLGHAAGDEVLRAFGQRLKACVRGSDLVARLAGDEFVVVLEQLSQGDEAQAVARKIVASMEEPVLWNDEIVPVSASIGIAVSGRAPAEASAATLMADADEALYAAKRSGRNTFRVGGGKA